MIQSLKKITNIFEKEKIRYCLIGGLAVSFYAEPRSTFDIDILALWPEPQEIFFDILERNSVKFNYIKSSLADPVGDIIKAVIDNVSIDIIMARFPHEIDFVNNAIEVTIEEKEKFKIISLYDLIAQKLLAGGPKDLFDVAMLLKYNQKNISLDSLKLHLQKYKINLEPFLKFISIYEKDKGLF
ncbi:DUF6036 family nucleotidyltransferase [Carboxydothermus hydrogenoformans]|uniref:DUF6036 domain-containing protein n=1 Tax=Carboxydothermus hydrogenoformans (strain ATCC BAA-161 / DSM 6008 / Z-2901) TaxID=246194 RepID=Q3AEQ0_CARHZ|nr:DUF6036 family nucleotidyltransferase [Carboxydothermus hydrogenoformans]ABB13947.1 hypothetical protein CHY_0526 [Carboxydothermus hydrogenoformans Z-2901]